MSTKDQRNVAIASINLQADRIKYVINEYYLYGRDWNWEDAAKCLKEQAETLAKACDAFARMEELDSDE